MYFLRLKLTANFLHCSVSEVISGDLYCRVVRSRVVVEHRRHLIDFAATGDYVAVQ